MQSVRPQILDGDTVRDMTDAELAQHELDVVEFQEQTKRQADRAKLKADTLAKLGLTEAEVAALLS
jgi:adenylylsulfate kinase-like enzyme